MPYLCKNCGNKTEFYEDVYGTESFSERHYVNEEGDTIDYGDRDYGDTDIDDSDPIKCQECDDEVENVSDEEWEEYGNEAKKVNWRD